MKKALVLAAGAFFAGGARAKFVLIFRDHVVAGANNDTDKIYLYG